MYFIPDSVIFLMTVYFKYEYRETECWNAEEYISARLTRMKSI